MPDFFDRLIEEIVSSAPAPGGPAVRRPVAGLRGLRFTRPSARARPGRRLLVAIALLCVPGTLGGLALAGTFEGQRSAPNSGSMASACRRQQPSCPLRPPTWGYCVAQELPPTLCCPGTRSRYALPDGRERREPFTFPPC